METRMQTWIITKELSGHLAGITVTEKMTCDASLGAPFTAGQRIPRGLGCGYTVTSCVPA